MELPDLTGRVAIVTGSSRGIGRSVALKLAEAGCDVCIAARSTESKGHLPGSIHHTAAEVEALGRRAIAVQCDVRNDADLTTMVERTRDELGRIDILVNNAGALWWKDVVDTPMNRFDLVVGVNARAAFAATHAVLPTMIEQQWGHIIMMSPPVDIAWANGKVAYCISKFGMTLIAHGLAEEVAEHNIACNALWPATLIESQATINYQLGSPEVWRKADIVADATLAIVGHSPSQLSGEALLDEDILRRVGVTDFEHYKCTPDGNPTSIFTAAGTHNVGGSTTR